MTNLKIKEKYIQIVESVKKIAVSVGLPEKKIVTLIEVLRNHELLIPVVGEFSAGKSSFLNSFIGRKVLSVAGTPETAVATELRYSAEEYAEILVENGGAVETKRMSVEEVGYVQKEWRCIRLYLNAENLKTIEPLVMVDMPGFDSPRDDHNRAITSYLNRGVHYVVLTSVESGTVTASMKRQIQDIQNMGRGCSFFVSKANLRSEEDVKSIAKEVRDQVEDILGESVDVKSLGKDAGAELNKLLASIDPETLFARVFKETLIQVIDEQSSAVVTKIAALKNDREKNKRAICDMEEALDKLLKKRDELILEAKNCCYEDDVDSIIAAAGNAVSADINRLVDMAMQGMAGDVISQEINSIVRSAVIPAVNDVTKGISEKISTNFQMELKAYEKTFSLLDNPEFIAKLGAATAPLGDMAKIAFNGMANVAQKAATKVGLEKAYKTIVGVAAIATDVICPLAEVVVLLLPEIIGAISNFISQKRHEEKQRESIRSQILNAIPRMKRDLRSKIEPELQKQNEIAIQTISEEFNGRVKSLMDNIQKANDSLENNDEVVEKMQLLEKAKAELSQLKSQI